MDDIATPLTILGALCEAGGIVLTVREFVRVEDREFPEKRNRLVRMWRRVQRRLGRKPPAQVIEVGSIASAEAFGHATIRVDRARVEDPDDLEARIERLERAVDDRDREHRATLERIEAPVGDVEVAHARSLEGLRADLDQAGADEREALRESLTLQRDTRRSLQSAWCSRRPAA